MFFYCLFAKQFVVKVYVIAQSNTTFYYVITIEVKRERDHWGDLGVDGWILGWISRRWDVGIWTGLGWPRIGTGGGRL